MKTFYVCKHAPFIKSYDTLTVIGSIFWNWATPCRFGFLNDDAPYNMKPLDKPLPCGNAPKESMEELCVIVAKELLAKYSDKEFVISWSGGVDSTAILASLILAGIPKDKLIVIYTPSSIKENPNFYSWLRKFGARMICFPWESIIKVINKFPKAIFLTGWCADQLFGSNINLVFPQYYSKPFADTAIDFIHNRGFYNFSNDKSTLNNILDKWFDFAEQIKLPIYYTCEALWFFNFVVKWHHVAEDFKLTVTDDNQRENVINFFEDIRFQEWSMANYKNLINFNQFINPKSYKRELKNVIYSLNKDDDYLLNKGKVNSWLNWSPAKGLAYSTFSILDDEGYHQYNFQEVTPWSKKYLNLFTRQEANRRYWIKEYVKPHITEDQLREVYWSGYGHYIQGSKI